MQPESKNAETNLELPRHSVKRIMKLSDEVSNVSAVSGHIDIQISIKMSKFHLYGQDAVVCVTKLTEDFIGKVYHTFSSVFPFDCSSTTVDSTIISSLPRK